MKLTWGEWICEQGKTFHLRAQRQTFSLDAYDLPDRHNTVNNGTEILPEMKKFVVS